MVRHIIFRTDLGVNLIDFVSCARLFIVVFIPFRNRTRNNAVAVQDGQRTLNSGDWPPR